MPLKCFYCFIDVIKHASHCQMNHKYIINSTKIGAICQITPRFGTNTLHNLHGHSLHIHCLASLLMRLIVFLYLISSGKSVHSGVHGSLGFLGH